APVDASPKINSSAIRPPSSTAILFSSSDLVTRNRSSVGNWSVYPSAAIPRGMIEIFCTESAPGTDTNVTHIAAGTASGLFLELQLADSPTSLSKRGIEHKLNTLDLSF